MTSDEYDTDVGYWDVEINPQGEYVNVFYRYTPYELEQRKVLDEWKKALETK